MQWTQNNNKRLNCCISQKNDQKVYSAVGVTSLALQIFSVVTSASQAHASDFNQNLDGTQWHAYLRHIMISLWISFSGP